jgi:RecG-like helicase
VAPKPSRPGEPLRPGKTNGGGSPAEQDNGQPAAPGITPIGSLSKPGRATVEGRIRVVEIRPVERNSVLACEISDGTGQLTALFYGRSHIPGIVCGARVRFRGSVGIRSDGQPVMTNPAYELIFPAV